VLYSAEEFADDPHSQIIWAGVRGSTSLTCHPALSARAPRLDPINGSFFSDKPPAGAGLSEHHVRLFMRPEGQAATPENRDSTLSRFPLGIRTRVRTLRMTPHPHIAAVSSVKKSFGLLVRSPMQHLGDS
jgi:hypothetical protein